MRPDSTGTCLLLPSPWPTFKVTYGKKNDTQVVKRWEPAAKPWSQQPGQLTRQQQPDGTAGIVSPAWRWQWDGTAFFCLTASNHVFFFLQWQACAITSSPGGLQTSLYPANKNTACRAYQLPNHTHSDRLKRGSWVRGGREKGGNLTP